MQNQLPLFLPYDHVHALPIVLKYQKIFDQLDLSDLPEFNAGIGANGTSQHALLSAFLIRSLESLKTVPALIRFLLANPALIFLCGFRNQSIPHDSQFYRFLKNTKHSLIEDLLFKANKVLIEKNVLSLRITAVDSKPVKALTKHNNPKNPSREMKNKNKKIKRNPKATLGYYSYVPTIDPLTRKKHFTFFWGYRSHAIVDATSGLAIVEATYHNNMPDEKSHENCTKNSKNYISPKTASSLLLIKPTMSETFILLSSIRSKPSQLSRLTHEIHTPISTSPPMDIGSAQPGLK